MALGSTQPLNEMSTRVFTGGKGGRCVRLTTLPPSCAVVMKSANLNFLEPSWPLQACDGTALPFFTLYIYIYIYINTHTNTCVCVVGGRDSSVGIATTLRTGRSGDRIPVRGEIFRARPDRPWGPPRPPIQWVTGLSRGLSGRDVALTTYSHLAPRLTKE